MVRVIDMGRSISESITFTAVRSRIGELGRYVADSFTFTTIRSSVFGLHEYIHDSMSFTVSSVRSVDFIRAISQPVTHSEVAARLVDAFRYIADSFTITDSHLYKTIDEYLRYVFDAFTYTVSSIRSIEMGRGLADNPTLASVVSRAVEMSRYVSDSFTQSVAVERVKGLIRAVAESITVSVAQSRSVALLRTLSQAITHSETAVRLIEITRFLYSSSILSDFVDYLKTLYTAPTAPTGLAGPGGVLRRPPGPRFVNVTVYMPKRVYVYEDTVMDTLLENFNMTPPVDIALEQQLVCNGTIIYDQRGVYELEDRLVVRHVIIPYTTDACEYVVFAYYNNLNTTMVQPITAEIPTLYIPHARRKIVEVVLLILQYMGLVYVIYRISRRFAKA
jgi:hypothetical protein